MELSSPEIYSITKICQKYGVASKLTGGGQGGMVIAFIIKNELAPNQEFSLL